MHPYVVCYYFGFFTKFLSLLLNILVFYLLQHGREDVAVLYKHLLKLSVILDFVYIAAGAFFCPAILFIGSHFFLVFDTWILPKSTTMAEVSFFVMSMLTYTWVGILPVQPVVRYYNVASKPCTKGQINLIFLAGIITVFAYTWVCTLFYRVKNDECDRVLEEQSLYSLKDPMYVVFESSLEYVLWPMTINICLTATSCFIVFVYIMKTRWKMWSLREHMTPETVAMQKRMGNIIILQTVYPIFCLILPAIMIGIYPVIRLSFSPAFFSIYSTICLHSYSMLNPLSIIFCIPSNRRAVIRMLRCQPRKRHSVAVSSFVKDDKQ